MALLEWDLFTGKQKRTGEDGEEAVREGGREGGGEGEEDTGGVATAGQVAAPWMLRPRYETTVMYDSQEGREGGRQGRRKQPKTEEEEEEEAGMEEGGEEVFDESRREGWEAAIARTFDETRRGEGLAPREKGGKGPLWVAEIVPNLEQWANELVVVHFGNELRGREEEAAKEAPLFVVEGREGGREEGLVHGATVKAGYMRGKGHATVEEAREGGGVVSKAFEPARYYQLEVSRTDGGGGGGGGAAAAAAAAAVEEGGEQQQQQQQQYLLLLVQPETGEVSMCPTVANVKVKKVDRAASGKPARGVRLVHRALGEEEKEGRALKLMKAGVEEEAVESLR